MTGIPGGHAEGELLDFRLPEFTRVSWVSDPARLVWAPRLERIAAAWREVEWASVRSGVRAAAIVERSVDAWMEDAPRWAEQGVAAVPVERSARGGLVLALGQARDLAAVAAGWRDGDPAAGTALGWPRCCWAVRRAVQERALLDATWAAASATADPGVRIVEVAGAPATNVFWRALSVQLVPHLPCSFECQATAELASRLREVGVRAGHAAEMDWAEEILSWPLEWSALHGIAEIKTPVLKLAVRTDATSQKFVVRLRGERLPAEAAAGSGFAYRPPRGGLSDSAGYRRGMEQDLVQKSGSFFSYGETRLGQGRNNAKQFLVDNPELALEIETKVRTALGIDGETAPPTAEEAAPAAAEARAA